MELERKRRPPPWRLTALGWGAAMAIFAGSAFAQGPGAPQPVINEGGVVDAASFEPVLAPGGIGSLFGIRLADTAQAAARTPLPLEMAGTRVEINATPAPLFFVSEKQINFQTPFEALLGAGVAVVVFRNGVASEPVTVRVAPFAPAVFAVPATREPIVQRNASGALIHTTNPARPGDVLTAYLTGIGEVRNAPPNGAPAPAEPLAVSTVMPRVIVNDIPAETLFAGLTPGFVALAQVNFRLPEQLATAETERRAVAQSTPVPLVFVFDGNASQPVDLTVEIPRQPGAISVSPAGLDFGDVPVGESRTRTLEVRNSGAGVLRVIGWETGGGSFQAASRDLPLRLSPGGIAEVLVSFSPQSAGARSGMLTIRSDDPLSPSLSVLLAGRGVDQAGQTPELSFEKGGFDFDEVTLGATGIAFFPIRNAGAATLRVEQARILDSTQFRLQVAQLPISLAPGAEMNLNVQFTPVLVGPAAATLQLISNDPDLPVADVPLLGYGASEVATDLPNGVAEDLTLPAAEQSSLAPLFFTVLVPEGAARLEVTLRTFTSGANLDLFLRFDRPVAVEGGSVQAEHQATTSSGFESLTITPQSSTALRAGRYFIGIWQGATGVETEAALTATVRLAEPQP